MDNKQWSDIVDSATHIPPSDYSRGKHWSGNSENERRQNSSNKRPSQFLYSMTAEQVKELERETLLTGERKDRGGGNYSSYKEFSEQVGYDNGEDAYGLRAELTSASGSPAIHSHPRRRRK